MSQPNGIAASRRGRCKQDAATERYIAAKLRCREVAVRRNETETNKCVPCTTFPAPRSSAPPCCSSAAGRRKPLPRRRRRPRSPWRRSSERHIAEWDEFIGRLEAVQSGRDPAPRLGLHRARRLQRRQRRPQGRSAVPDRRAPVPGRAGPGASRAGPGPQRRRAGAGARWNGRVPLAAADAITREEFDNRTAGAEGGAAAVRAAEAAVDERAPQPRVDACSLADSRPGRPRGDHRRQPGPGRRAPAADDGGFARSDLRQLRRR